MGLYCRSHWTNCYVVGQDKIRSKIISKISFFNSHKVLTSLVTGLLGIIGGVAAGAYGVGVEKTKTILKLESHDQKFIEIMNLIHEDNLRTNNFAEKISETVTQIQIDIGILKYNSNPNHK